MTFHNDGDVMDRARWPRRREVLAFGWLDASHPFRTGNCPPEVLLTLESAAQKMKGRSRGWHSCEMCGADRFGPTLHPTSTGDLLELGSAVIELARHGSSARWRAPNLVLHYITAHGYRPPDVVIEVCAGA